MAGVTTEIVAPPSRVCDSSHEGCDRFHMSRRNFAVVYPIFGSSSNDAIKRAAYDGDDRIWARSTACLQASFETVFTGKGRRQEMEEIHFRESGLIGIQAVYSKGECVYRHRQIEHEAGIDQGGAGDTIRHDGWEMEREMPCRFDTPGTRKFELYHR